MAKNKEINKLELNFPKKLDVLFTEWLSPKVKPKVVNNYRAWLNQLPNYLRVEYGVEESLSDEVKEVIKKVKFRDDYLKLIDEFVREGDRLYAMSVYDKVYEIVKLAKDKSVNTDETKWKNNWGNRHSAFVALGDFLHEHKYDHIENVDNINEERKRIPKNALRKIDGMDTLLSLVDGDKTRFIEMAIDGSFFFNPELVNNQVINWGEAKARHTTDTSINKDNVEKPKKEVDKEKAKYMIDEEEIEVYIDSDNNRYVRRLINDETGVTVASGKDSLIQNTVISHVWGRAYAPRYFTSLWNIVLIPAWANSLMDKEMATPGSLASQMRATYMAICSKLYKKGFKSEIYKLNKFPGVQHPKEIVKLTYSFNEIGKKEVDAVIIKKGRITII